MVFFKDLFPLFDLHPLWESSLNSISATLLSRLNDSMPGATCSSGELEACRDDSAALTLKLVSIAAILLAGAVGIAIPILGKHRKFLRTESNLFVAAKAFAAGVILATGFVHMLPDASSSLSDPCLPAYPWADFPFAGFFAMCSALFTLLADFVGTQVYERKQRRKRLGGATDPAAAVGRVGSSELYGTSADQLPVSVVEVDKEELEEDGNGNQNRKETCSGGHCRSGKVFGEEADGGMHIVGIRAHAAHHRHSHSHGQKGCDGHVVDVVVPSGSTALGHGHGHQHGSEENGDGDDHFGHSHVHGGVEEDNESRHVVVSQVLELGIVSHSVIIGLSLGVSHSPCTIRPLMGALSFHQFFEGFALGGCISQAHLKKQATIIMACFFALTTPAGIGAGIAVASTYNSSSARALIIEGILDSVSAGILIYMALVDLIAADFLSKRMRCNVRLQVVSYLALFMGAGLMSLLAIWA